MLVLVLALVLDQGLDQVQAQAQELVSQHSPQSICLLLIPFSLFLSTFTGDDTLFARAFAKLGSPLPFPLPPAAAHVPAPAPAYIPKVPLYEANSFVGDLIKSQLASTYKDLYPGKRPRDFSRDRRTYDFSDPTCPIPSLTDAKKLPVEQLRKLVARGISQNWTREDLEEAKEDYRLDEIARQTKFAKKRAERAERKQEKIKRDAEYAVYAAERDKEEKKQQQADREVQERLRASVAATMQPGDTIQLVGRTESEWVRSGDGEGVGSINYRFKTTTARVASVTPDAHDVVVRVAEPTEYEETFGPDWSGLHHFVLVDTERDIRLRLDIDRNWSLFHRNEGPWFGEIRGAIPRVVSDRPRSPCMFGGRFLGPVGQPVNIDFRWDGKFVSSE